MFALLPRASSYTRDALILITLLTLMAGCNLPRVSQPTPTPAESPALAPISSPTPTTPRMVLVAPSAGADPYADALVALAEIALRDLAMGASMDFLRVDALPETNAANVALLVALPVDPGIQAWAETHPDAQAVSLGIAGLQPARNLSVIAPDGIRYDQLGFALGYLAAMVTPEYRVGALVLDSSVASIALARGFVAGGTYYCGLCRPAHPPYVAYPAYLEGKPANLASEGLATLLVVPQLRSLAELGLATSSAISFMGPGEPAGVLGQSWIASADFDVTAALDMAWSQTESAEGGTTIPLGIRYHSVDPSVVTEGKLALAETLLADLSAGLIDTGIDPLTGLLR